VYARRGAKSPAARRRSGREETRAELVEHVEQLTHAGERCAGFGHFREHRRAQISQPKIVREKGLDALVVSRDNRIEIGTGDLCVRPQ
jgi:hypothetical protein